MEKLELDGLTAEICILIWYDATSQGCLPDKSIVLSLHMTIYITSLSLVTFLILKFTSSDINIATQTFL